MKVQEELFREASNYSAKVPDILQGRLRLSYFNLWLVEEWQHLLRREQ